MNLVTKDLADEGRRLLAEYLAARDRTEDQYGIADEVAQSGAERTKATSEEGNRLLRVQVAIEHRICELALAVAGRTTPINDGQELILNLAGWMFVITRNGDGDGASCDVVVSPENVVTIA